MYVYFESYHFRTVKDPRDNLAQIYFINEKIMGQSDFKMFKSLDIQWQEGKARTQVSWPHGNKNLKNDIPLVYSVKIIMSQSYAS